MIRVFSNCPSRQASEEEQKAFEEQLASSAIPTQIGDIKTELLPGPEALFNPGRFLFLNFLHNISTKFSLILIKFKKWTQE